MSALERLNCSVLSTDAVVHEIQADPVHLAALAERFGEGVISDGKLDRAALASSAFGDEAGRQWLESYIWPLVGQRISEWVESLDEKAQRPVAGVVEVPLLFESGMDKAFDSTICVVADEGLRAERAASRGHVAVDERTARQLSQEEKSSRATWIVQNDGSEAELEKALSAVLAEMVV